MSSSLQPIASSSILFVTEYPTSSPIGVPLLAPSHGNLPLWHPHMNKSKVQSFSSPLATDYVVLMAERSEKMSSFKKAHVFPGGLVDKADYDMFWKDYLPSHYLKLYKSSFLRINENSSLFEYRIAAIRELFEETGICLVKPRIEFTNSQELKQWRDRVHNDATQFQVLCRNHDSLPMIDQLSPHLRMRTPLPTRKLFDTFFFLFISPRIESVSVDDTETASLYYATPWTILDRMEQGLVRLYPPQWYLLARWSLAPNVGNQFKSLMEHWKTELNDTQRIPALQWPELVTCPSMGPCAVLPGDPLHSIQGSHWHRMIIDHFPPEMSRMRLALQLTDSKL